MKKGTVMRMAGMVAFIAIALAVVLAQVAYAGQKGDHDGTTSTTIEGETTTTEECDTTTTSEEVTTTSEETTSTTAEEVTSTTAEETTSTTAEETTSTTAEETTSTTVAGLTSTTAGMTTVAAISSGVGAPPGPGAGTWALLGFAVALAGGIGYTTLRPMFKRK
jgi:cytoskeletal protein RodZ